MELKKYAVYALDFILFLLLSYLSLRLYEVITQNAFVERELWGMELGIFVLIYIGFVLPVTLLCIRRLNRTFM